MFSRAPAVRMDEMEHGSNVVFEARDMGRALRESRRGEEAATLEQAADDFADRVPENIRDDYTWDAYWRYRSLQEDAPESRWRPRR